MISIEEQQEAVLKASIGDFSFFEKMFSESENYVSPEPAEILQAVKDSGLSKTEFCKRVGIARTTLPRWLNGKQKIGYMNWNKIKMIGAINEQK